MPGNNGVIARSTTAGSPYQWSAPYPVAPLMTTHARDRPCATRGGPRDEAARTASARLTA